MKQQHTGKYSQENVCRWSVAAADAVPVESALTAVNKTQIDTMTQPWLVSTQLPVYAYVGNLCHHRAMRQGIALAVVYPHLANMQLSKTCYSLTSVLDLTAVNKKKVETMTQ